MGTIITFPPRNENDDEPFEVVNVSMMSDGRMTIVNSVMEEAGPEHYLWVHENLVSVMQYFVDRRKELKR